MPTPAPLSVLSLSNLRKSVPGGRVLFDGLDLELARGELVAIMGESGAGKSTLLNLIAGLDQPDAGRCIVEGGELSNLDGDASARLRRDRIGFVFQAFHILPHLTLAQDVALPLVLQHRGRDDALEHATDLLTAVGIGGRRHEHPSQLPGGEPQRGGIARAVVHDPAIFIDLEPTRKPEPEHPT